MPDGRDRCTGGSPIDPSPPGTGAPAKDCHDHTTPFRCCPAPPCPAFGGAGCLVGGTGAGPSTQGAAPGSPDIAGLGRSQHCRAQHARLHSVTGSSSAVNDPGTECSAVLSDCGTYRYSLTRRRRRSRAPARAVPAYCPALDAGQHPQRGQRPSPTQRVPPPPVPLPVGRAPLVTVLLRGLLRRCSIDDRAGLHHPPETTRLTNAGVLPPLKGQGSAR